MSDTITQVIVTCASLHSLGCPPPPPPPCVALYSCQVLHHHDHSVCAHWGAEYAYDFTMILASHLKPWPERSSCHPRCHPPTDLATASSVMGSTRNIARGCPGLPFSHGCPFCPPRPEQQQLLIDCVVAAGLGGIVVLVAGSLLVVSVHREGTEIPESQQTIKSRSCEHSPLAIITFLHIFIVHSISRLRNHMWNGKHVCHVLLLGDCKGRTALLNRHPVRRAGQAWLRATEGCKY